MPSDTPNPKQDASAPFADPSIGVTTVEKNEFRSQVKPYAETPVLELAPGVIACVFCGNTNFRRSRVRFTDLAEVLMFQFPVRCTRCGQRQYNDCDVAFLAAAPKSLGMRTAKGADTWKSWTAPQEAVNGDVRPLSTVIGPRARRLEAATSVQRSTAGTSRASSADRAPVTPRTAAPAERPAPPPRTPSRKDHDGIW